MSRVSYIRLGNTQYRIYLGNDKYYIDSKEKELGEHFVINWDHNNPNTISFTIANPTERTLYRLGQERLFAFVSVENDRCCCPILGTNINKNKPIQTVLSTRGMKRSTWFIVKPSVTKMTALTQELDLSGINFDGTDISNIDHGLLRDYKFAQAMGYDIKTKYINFKIGLIFVPENMLEQESNYRYYKVCGINDEYLIDSQLVLNFL